MMSTKCGALSWRSKTSSSPWGLSPVLAPVLALGLFLGGTFSLYATKVDEPPTAQDLIELCGEANPSNPYFEQAYEIFEILRRAAFLPPSLNVRLTVVGCDLDSLNAFTEASGHIVLSHEVVTTAYGIAGNARGRAKLAFVIAHEISHLSSDDPTGLDVLSHLTEGDDEHGEEAIMAILGRSGKSSKGGKPTMQEIRADWRALELMTVAEFDTWRLLSDGAELAQWIDRLDGLSQPEPGERPSEASLRRMEGIATRSREIAGRLDLFRFGKRLSDLDRHLDALTLLQEFRQRFDGPALANAIGLAEVGLALRGLLNCSLVEAVPFYLPVLTDGRSAAEGLVSRAVGPSCRGKNSIAKRLDRAGLVFADLASRYPTYRPGLWNGAATAILANDRRAAASFVARLQDAQADDPDVIAMAAAADYLASTRPGREFLADKALKDLGEAVTRWPDHPGLLYNRAAILEFRGRQERKDAWREFLGSGTDDLYARIAAVRLGEDSIPQRRRGAQSGPTIAPSPSLGGLTDAARIVLGKMEISTLMDSGPKIEVYRQDYPGSGEVSVLVFDGRVEIVEQPYWPKTEARLIQIFGDPVRTVRSLQGETWIYDGFGFDLVDGVARRIFHFEPDA